MESVNSNTYSNTNKQYQQEYYLKNKEKLNQRRLANYYSLRYTPDQLAYLQIIKPHKRIPQLTTGGS